MAILKIHTPLDSNHIVGNKALGLCWLQDHGFEVPRFFAIAYDSLKRYRNNGEELTMDLKNWERENSINPVSTWSVRSSATVEDGQTQSYAGRFKTLTDVALTDLPRAISEVVHAYEVVEGAFEYGVVLQEMVTADFSGVLFTHDPLNMDSGSGVINLIPGKGENLVSGEMTALSIQLNGELPTDLEEEFNGVRGQVIYSSVKPLLKNFGAAVTQILKLKSGQAQDLEFCIKNGRIYWLQIRPMTTPQKQKVVRIWDNTQSEGNFSGMTSPLSISFVQQTLGVAYRNMAVYMGCSREVLEAGEPFFKQYCGNVYGRLYYNLNAWQYSLYQCPFGEKLVRQLLKTWGTEEALLEKPAVRNSAWRRFRMIFRFLGLFLKFRKMQRKYERDYQQLLEEFKRIDLQNKSHEELVRIEKSAEQKFGALWLTPSLNGFFVIILFYLLHRKIRKSGLANDYPNFFNDVLYSQDEVISVQLVNDFRKIMVSIQQDSDLKKLFATEEASGVLMQLNQKFPETENMIQEYIGKYGLRTTEGEMKIETINYREDPKLFLEFIQANLAGSFSQRAEKLDWEAVVNKRYSLNFLNRWYFKYLIRSTIRSVKNRENYRFYRAEVYDMIRQILRAMDRELLTRGRIDQKSDTHYLTLDEVCNPLRSAEYRDLISARKEEYKSWETQEMTRRFHELENGTFEMIYSPLASSGSAVIKGIGCSSGICRAKVKMIRSREDILQDVTGFILVGGNFEPGWINLFSQAAGIISERGNLLSHTAILCREIGIPSIVGAKHILSLVKEGDVLFMNGATGEIEIQHEDEI